MDTVFEQRINAEIAAEFSRSEPPAGFPQMPDLPLGRYTDAEMFGLEMARVFRRTWVFAAHTSELASPGSYRTLDLCGLSVLLVRGEHEIKAFVNACRHRGAPVVRDECGTCQLLVCQYHSWSYDLDGNLVRVPDERDFVGLDPAQRGLVAIRCESFGGFVFVCADTNTNTGTDTNTNTNTGTGTGTGTAPLIEWLGPLAGELGHVAESSLRVVQRSSTDVRCNWKIMAEGFLEVYHLRTIHSQTVAHLLDHRGAAISLIPGGHSRMITPLRPERVVPLADLPGGSGEQISGMTSDLYRTTNPAYGIFPNLITPLDPRGFPFLLFWPIAIDRTRLEIVWFAKDWGDGERHSAWDLRLAGFDMVMLEDTRNLEPIQRSVSAAAHGGIPLNYQERRIWHLHATIDKMIGAGSVPHGLGVPDVLREWVDP